MGLIMGLWRRLFAGRYIFGELTDCMGMVSVSLNYPDSEKYQALFRRRLGEQAFLAIHVVMITVTTIITHKEERCRAICREVGADYRIRPWEK